MNKIKWVHLSDLHFGSGETTTIRNLLLDFLDKIKDEEFKYLFISGDIFYAPHFFKTEKEKEKTIEDAVSFILKVISSLKICKSNVFIVPGNHDTDRQIEKKNSKKEQYINGIQKNYEDLEDLDVKKLSEFQKDFNKFCKRVNTKKYDNETQRLKKETNRVRVNFCELGHKSVIKDDIDVLMLNSSLSSCKDNDTLLLGAKSFINEIHKTRLGNDTIPLFVLSHHHLHNFHGNDFITLKTHLKNKKGTLLYLCGHEHHEDIHKLDDIIFLVCGTHLKKDHKHKKLNEVSFLTGVFDTTLAETKVSYYKWHYGKAIWMKNRDISEDYPYYEEIITENSPKKEVLSSNTESEAVRKFLLYLLETLKNETKNKPLDFQCTYFQYEMNNLLDLIKERNPAWKFHAEFRTKFNRETDIEKLLKIIEIEYTNHVNVKDALNHKIEILEVKIDEKIKRKKTENVELKHIGILLYSKSIRVTDYLLALPQSYKQKVIIYICSGDVRSNSNLYKDAYDIASELYETIRKFNGFKQVRLIPDVYVDKLMNDNKIQFVLMGAHSLYYCLKNFTHFDNTTGSNLIIDLAKNYEIECLIVADISKAYNIYPYSNVNKKLETIESFTFPTLPDIVRHISTDFYHYELVDIRDIQKKGFVTIITDAEKNPWEGSQELTSETIEKFANKILKDRRKLVLNDKCATIEKYFLTEDKKLECDVLLSLLNSKINVPHIKEQKEDCIILNYYKGIRVFNLIVSINNLKNKYEESSIEHKKLINIAEKILKRCEDNQRKIQKGLFNKFKKSTDISKYPREKLIDIIELLFSCIKLDDEINKDKVINEMNIVYSNFEKYAIIPFRDASVKNMILVNEDFYLKKFYENEKERNDYIQNLFVENKLEAIIDESDIVDIDFSSCINYTTPYDDVISFRFHESTASYFNVEDIEIWNEELNNEEIRNKKEDIILATFIVRLLRFGGRKLLYKIIAPAIHSKRFKYDDESYYFEKLQNIIMHYNVQYLPESFKLFKKIEGILASGNRRNFFIIHYDNIIIERKIKDIRKKETYSDVFPY